MPLELNQNNLAAFPENVAVPGYERDGIAPGILHVGVGNFHRAHMAFYLDQLFSMGEDHDWAILGAGVRDADRKMREILLQQDCLTTVVELDPLGLSARIVGSMIDYLPVDADAIIGAMSDPQIRIVSLTVTEGGYYVDGASGKLQMDHPDILADAKTPGPPRTIFGMIVAALKSRRDNGVVPFTVLSCDNLPGNGHVAQQSVVGLARLSDTTLADWIVANVAFPNCMVDCITPATAERERQLVYDSFGVADNVPVACEPFRQWIIEDQFSAGRPSLEKVGVEFVEDVLPYELVKLRILNAGHASIAYVSALLGYHFVHAAMADADIRDWVRTLNVTDIIPTLAPIDGVDYVHYLDTVITRFSNTEIADTIPRLAADGSDRQPKFILPTLRDALAGDSSISGLALEIALWAHYCAGTAEDGTEIKLIDPLSFELRQRALEAKHHPRVFLENAGVFGNLANNPRLASSFAQWLMQIQARGVRQTLKSYLAS